MCRSPGRRVRRCQVEPVFQLDLHPWEYPHDIGDGQIIHITAPGRWILSYRSSYSPAQLRETLATGQDRRPDDLKKFLVNTLALQLSLYTFQSYLTLGVLAVLAGV